MTRTAQITYKPPIAFPLSRDLPKTFFKNLKKLFKKVLTNGSKCGIIYTERKREVNNNDE